MPIVVSVGSSIPSPSLSSGGMTTVQLYVAGVGSTLVAASMARTAKVWMPLPSGPSARLETQGMKAAPSRLHSKLPGSLEENEKTTFGPLGSPGLTVIVVSGGAVSTVQVYEAGLVSALKPSNAATCSVCEPSPSAGVV